MTCIETDIIQRYIDKEVNREEASLIETHINQCKACKAKIEGQRNLAILVKNTFNQLNKEKIDIPEFINPAVHNTKHVITTRRLIYSVAAACTFLFLLFKSNNQESAVDKSEYIMQLADSDYNANRTLLEQKMIIEIIDPEGNVSEYFFE